MKDVNTLMMHGHLWISYIKLFDHLHMCVCDTHRSSLPYHNAYVRNSGKVKGKHSEAEGPHCKSNLPCSLLPIFLPKEICSNVANTGKGKGF